VYCISRLRFSDIGGMAEVDEQKVCIKFWVRLGKMYVGIAKNQRKPQLLLLFPLCLITSNVYDNFKAALKANLISCGRMCPCDVIVCLTLNLLKTTIVAPPINASKWKMGFNSAFKGLKYVVSMT
jgi:hypothetical protein